MSPILKTNNLDSTVSTPLVQALFIPNVPRSFELIDVADVYACDVRQSRHSTVASNCHYNNTDIDIKIGPMNYHLILCIKVWTD